MCVVPLYQPSSGDLDLPLCDVNVSEIKTHDIQLRKTLLFLSVDCYIPQLADHTSKHNNTGHNKNVDGGCNSSYIEIKTLEDLIESEKN